MKTNPEEKERWALLPTAEQWSRVTAYMRTLLAIDDPQKRRRKLELLSLEQPRLARRLATVMGMTLAT